jgi:hypothetical protein
MNPMNFTVTIPDEFVEPLHAAVGGDLSRAALEQLALEGYRSQKLSRYQVQQLLGFDNRWTTEQWLGQHGAVLNYGLDDLEADRETLDRVLGDAEP